ncbi:MAG: zf-HC2 domain-containing protein [Pyrinomonadaceae bacterium]
MELEFDKEMDALLRKAATRGVLIGDKPKSHLDADAISAFAENALPAKSRTIYMQHLAECDPCRKTLANFVTLSADAEAEFAAKPTPVIPAAIPWYRMLFVSHNLAYTMGALVLVFGGLLGFIAIQNSYFGESATVSQLKDTETTPPAPSAPARAESAAANITDSNASSNAAGEIPRSMGSSETFAEAGNVVAPPPPTMNAPPAGDIKLAEPAKGVMIDGLDSAVAQPAPKEVAKSTDEKRQRVDDRTVSTEEERKQDADKSSVREQQLNQNSAGSGNKDVGPSRSAVQRDNRLYDSDAPVSKAKKMEEVVSKPETLSGLRNAGGKKFEQKQGVWYDTAYSGQKTKNIRRGTDEYRKLDSGLRSIAESIGGIVLVVWKDRAYRIQ